MRRELEHPDHQRDPDRVVRARLALEDRPDAAADLAPAEHREHHRRVGRRERGAEDARGRPAEVEQRSARRRAISAGRRERAERRRATTIGTAERAEPAPADVHPAVEEDHDQRDDADPLDRPGSTIASPSDGKMSEATAAASRKSAGAGIGSRPTSWLASEREREAAGDDEDDVPKSAISFMPSVPVIEGSEPFRPSSALTTFLTDRSLAATPGCAIMRAHAARLCLVLAHARLAR